MEPAPRARAAQQPPQQPKYDLSRSRNPAAAIRSRHRAHFAAAPREFHAAATAARRRCQPHRFRRVRSARSSSRTPPARAALAPELPPDHPLEPGTRPGGRVATPSERIAASESAISEIPAAPKEPVSSSSFIAAARRAAQAAAAHAGKAGPRRQGAQGGQGRPRQGQGQEGGSTITSKIRSLLVGASVVVIVLGTFKMAMNLLDGGSPPPAPQAMENSSSPPAPQAPPPVETKPATPEQVTPSMTSPTPIGKQSLNNRRAGAHGSGAAARLRSKSRRPRNATAARGEQRRHRRAVGHEPREARHGPGAAKREAA